MDSKFNGQQEALYFEKPTGFQFLLLKKLLKSVIPYFERTHTGESFLPMQDYSISNVVGKKKEEK